MYSFMHNASVPGCGGYGWAQFCRDPGGGVAHATAQPACRAGFVAGWPAYKIYRHTAEQARCLTTAGGGLAVDYLLRTERLSEDLQVRPAAGLAAALCALLARVGLSQCGCLLVGAATGGAAPEA